MAGRSYSCLSRRSADLATSDIDLSAIRIFLRDGSHRTVSTTPNMTCGEVLDKLLDKLDLMDQRDQYGLCLKYMLSEPCIANDSDFVGELNPNIWDRLERIYLSQKDPESLYNTARRRKKNSSVVSARGRQITESKGNGTEAIITSVTSVTWKDKCNFQGVTNQKVAASFSSAWSEGNSIVKLREERFPALDKKPIGIEEEEKDDDIFSMRPYRQSSREQKSSQYSSESCICLSNSSYSLGPNSRRMSFCSKKSSGVYEDVDSWLSPASSPVESNQTSSSKRDSGVLSSCESEETGNCIEGYAQMNQASTLLSNMNTNHSSPIHSQRSIPDVSASCHNHGNSARLVSYNSMELLSSDAINEISTFALCDSKGPSPPSTLSVSSSVNRPENAALSSPTIPKRSSSLIKSNQIITDKELIKQGQRLSQVLNLTPVPKRKVSLAIVKNTVAKFLKHRSSTDTMKAMQSSPPNATQANELVSKYKQNSRHCSASTTSLQNSHQVDTTSNYSYNHLYSWVGSSVNLKSSAPVQRSTQEQPQHSSHLHSSTYVSSFYRRAASVDNLCGKSTYFQESCRDQEGVAYFQNVTPCSTGARMWHDSDEFEDCHMYELIQSPEDESRLKNVNQGNEYINVNVNDYNPQEDQENGHRSISPSSCEKAYEEDEEYIDFDPLLDEVCDYKNIAPLMQGEEEYVDCDEGSDYEKMSHEKEMEDDKEEYFDFDPQKAEKLELNTLKPLMQKDVNPQLKEENEYANIGLNISSDMDPWKALSILVSQDNKADYHCESLLNIDHSSDDDLLQVNEVMPRAERGSEDEYTEMKHWFAVERKAVPIVDQVDVAMTKNIADNLEEEEKHKTVGFPHLNQNEHKVDPSFAPLLLGQLQERDKQQVLVDKEEQIGFHTDDEIGEKKVHEKMAEKKKPKLSSSRLLFKPLHGNPSNFSSPSSLPSQVQKLSTAQGQLCQSNLTKNPQSSTNKQIRRWSHANVTSTNTVNPESLSKIQQASEFQLRRSAPLTRKNMYKIHSSWLRTSGLGSTKNVNL